MISEAALRALVRVFGVSATRFGKHSGSPFFQAAANKHVDSHWHEQLERDDKYQQKQTRHHERVEAATIGGHERKTRDA